MRQCGGCTLCCKLLPMQAVKNLKFETELEARVHHDIVAENFAHGAIQDFDKPAGQPCPYQRHHKGCTIYNKRPFGCRVWHCRWLSSQGTEDLARPDRSHYVIDVMPDYVVAGGDDLPETNMPVLQVWIDPQYRDAHRDPAFRAYLKKMIDNGEIFGALLRFNDGEDSLFLSCTSEGKWVERKSDLCEPRSHTALEIAQNLGLKIDLG